MNVMQVRLLFFNYCINFNQGIKARPDSNDTPFLYTKVWQCANRSCPNSKCKFSLWRREGGGRKNKAFLSSSSSSTLSCLCGRAGEQPSSAPLQCQTGRKPGRPSMDFMFLSAHGRTHSCTETPTNKQTGGQAGRRQRAIRIHLLVRWISLSLWGPPWILPLWIMICYSLHFSTMGWTDFEQKKGFPWWRINMATRFIC